MRLPDDVNEPERFSPIWIAALFVVIIVALVLWLNRDNLAKSKTQKQETNLSVMQEQQEQVPPESTLSPENFDFWDKYPESTPEPVVESTPEPVIEDPATDGKHTKIINEDGEEEWVKIVQSLPKHAYDFTKLVKRSEFMQYLKDGKEVSFIGVDLSKYQEYVDFPKLKKAGVDFCMLRVGARGYETGQLVLDSYFRENIKRASDAGLEIGVYFFSQAVTQEEAIEEAQLVLDNIKEYEILYPIAYDMEFIENDTARVETLTRDERTTVAAAFLNHINNAGYTPMLYGDTEWLVKRIDVAKFNASCIWLAEEADIPKYPYRYEMWQYTTQGQVRGINGFVDLNISFVDYSAR